MQLTKVTLNGKALGDCPKCQGENSMYAISAMKWNQNKKWHHLKACGLCGFEQSVN